MIEEEIKNFSFYQSISRILDRDNEKKDHAELELKCLELAEEFNRINSNRWKFLGHSIRRHDRTKKKEEKMKRLIFLHGQVKGELRIRYERKEKAYKRNDRHRKSYLLAA